MRSNAEKKSRELKKNQRENIKAKPSLSASFAHTQKNAGENKFDRTKAHEKLVKQCLLELTTKGWFCWKNNSGAMKSGNRFQVYGLKGSSEIIGMTSNGTFVAIEIKTGKAVQNKHQIAFEKAVRKRFGIYQIIRSYEELKEWLVIFSLT
jgi:hypothetical protein